MNVILIQQKMEQIYYWKIEKMNIYIDNNLSLCELNCTYKGYNKETKKAICESESKV